MAWIELHQSLPRHRKTLSLASRLGIHRAQAMGHISTLWLWALDNAEDGDLTGIDPQVIAFGAEWDGDAEEFVRALSDAGFLNCDTDRVLIHDWHDYAGKLIESREKERQRSRRRRAEAKGTDEPTSNRRTTAGRPPDDQQTTVGTVPYPTVPKDDDDVRAHEEVKTMLGDALTWGHWVPHIPKLNDYADEMGWPVILIAMQRTLEHSSRRSWAYAKRILDHWSERRVRSPTDIERLDAEHEASKRRRAPTEANNPAHQPLLAPEGYVS